MEREQVREDASADMSSDISDGQRESTPGSMPHAESNSTLPISKALEGILSLGELRSLVHSPHSTLKLGLSVKSLVSVALGGVLFHQLHVILMIIVSHQHPAASSSQFSTPMEHHEIQFHVVLVRREEFQFTLAEVDYLSCTR